MSGEAQVILCGENAEDLMEAPAHEKPNLPALRRTLALLAVVCAFPAVVLWSQEIWLRPLWLLRADEGWLAFVAVGGMLFAVFVWPGGRQRGFWWKRVGTGVVIAAISMITALFIGRESAVQDLTRHPIISGSDDLVWPSTDQRWNWFRPYREWLEARGLPMPSGLSANSNPYTVWQEPLEHLVETSRWRVRREFMQQMMRDENHAPVLVYDWHRLFPAVTGQDVTLARRTEMLDWLNVLAHDASVAQTSRDAATFWMGLVVLTDADAFARWRVSVRDAMLACDDPPMCHSGDVWMRVLDVLLAYDTREEAIFLTGKLIRDPILMRRALRERVRGMEGHMQPMVDEIERQDALDVLNISTAMWVDLRHLADRQPDTPELAMVRHRLRDMMAAWLMEDAMRVRQRFGSHRFGTNIVADVILEMPDEVRASLAGHAIGILAKVDSIPGEIRSEDDLAAAIQQALMIRNFLDDDRRVALSERLADMMLLNTATSHEDEEPKTEIWMVKLLGFAGIWDDLNNAKKEQFGRELRSQLQAMSWVLHSNFYFIGMFSSMHFMHYHAGFSEAEQLVIATYPHRQGGNLAVHPACWWARDLRWEPKIFSAATIHAVVGKIESFTDSRANSLRVENREESFEFPHDATTRWLGLARRYVRHGLSLEDGLIAYLAEYGMVGTECLPDDLPKAIVVRPHLTTVLLRYPERARLSRWLKDEQGARRILNMFENKPHLRHLSGLAAYLAVNPPCEEVLDHIHSYFLSHATSVDRLSRLESFRILLRMEAGMAPDRREKFRRDVHQFMERDRPTMSEMSFSYFESSLHDRRSWIPWREDALSAEHGWREQVAGEIGFGRREHTVRNEDTDYPQTLFNHLMFANDVFQNSFGDWYLDPYPLDAPVPKITWLTEPPELTLEPTPWQRSRELYLKRPDLEFPDRGLFRPSRRTYGE